MTPLELLQHVKELGIVAVPVGDQLDLYDPDENLSEELLSKLIEQKQDILKYLRETVPSGPADGRIRRTEEKTYWSLSEAQKKIYFSQLLQPESTLYNTPQLVPIPGHYSFEEVTHAFEKLVQRHELLRSVLIRIGDEPYLSIPEGQKLFLSFVKIKAGGLDDFLRTSLRPFAMGELLVRANFLEIPDGKKYLHIDFHHLIVDAHSLSLLQNEFVKLLGRQHLPECLQYRDFVQWEQVKRRGDEYAKHKAYWEHQLSGSGLRTSLPYDFHKVDCSPSESGLLRFSLCGDTGAIRSFCQGNKVTLPVFLLSLVYTFLYKLTGLSDIILGTVVSQRDRSTFSSIVGPLINTLPIRVSIDPEVSIAELMRNVADTLSDGWNHQHVEFSDGVGSLKGNGEHRLFEVVFNHLATGTVQNARFDSHVNPDSAKFDVVFHTLDTGRSIEMGIEYRKKFYDDKSISLYAKYLRYVFEQIVESPALQIGALRLSSQDEMLSLSNSLSTTAEYPTGMSLVKRFEEVARLHPHRIALSFNDEQITYESLNKKAEGIVERILEGGVEGNEIIALCFEPSVNQIISIIAVLKAGCAYLPIDPALPAERKVYMLMDSGARLMLYENEDHAGFGTGVPDLTLLNICDLPSTPEAVAPTEGRSPLPQDIAYVIYTSGTTGRPKGVLIEHRNVVRLFFTEPQLYHFRENDIWTLFHTYSFDFSVWEIFGALLFGGKLVIVPANDRKDLRSYLKLISKCKVTVLNQTPSAFYRLSAEAEKDRDLTLAARLLIFGGEALSPLKLYFWKHRFPLCKIVNMYGITETTVHVTYREIDDDDIAVNRSVVGKPIPTLRCVVLDDHLQPAPAGVVGELYVAGEGVARGYLNNPELTAARFKKQGNAPGEIFYKTGDLARVSADHELHYLGRNDSQVQLRGFRIELQEVESVLMKCDVVQNCLVVKNEDGGNEHLVAYVVTRATLDVNDLKAQLLKTLPQYMIPSFFVEVDAIPLTANGKADLTALPRPGITTELSRTHIQYESELLAIWGTILNIKPSLISSTSSFFELGGNSLKMMELVSAIQEKLGLEVKLASLYEFHKLEQQCRHLLALAPKEFKTLKRIEKKQYYRLSYAQSRVLVLQKLTRHDVLVCNVPMIVGINNRYSVKDINDAFQILIDRHDVLRTSIQVVDNKMVQRVHTGVVARVESCTSGMEDAERVFKEFFQPFDLGKPPLLRVRLVKIEESERQFLFVDIHHIICDWISINTFKTEILSLLQGKSLPDTVPQYIDYLPYERSSTFAKLLLEDEQYWTDVFKDTVPLLRLPADYENRHKQDFSGANYTFEISSQLVEEVRQLSTENNVTVYSIFLSAYYLFLAEISRQTDIVVGMSVSGRVHPGLTRMAGVFINMIPVRTRIHLDQPSIAFINDVQKEVSNGLSHQRFPYERLIQKVAKPRGLSELFQAAFSLLNESDHKAETSPVDRKLNEMLKLNHQITHSDLLFYGVEFSDKVIFTVEYSPKTYKDTTILSYAAMYSGILKHMVNKPYDNIGDILSSKKWSTSASRKRSAIESKITLEF